MQQRAIRLAWENFLTNGSTPAGIPAPVLASWTRSKAFGVRTSVTEAPIAGEPEIFRRRTANADLLGASRSALDRSRALLADASSMMIITDGSGFIVETAGDSRVVDIGRRNHLELGGCWGESVIGTNAIGTALADGRPTQISGAEHFCEDVQRWTCAAVPVRHPIGGELLGIIDISGPASTFSAQDSALAAAIGQEVEASLGNFVRLEHEALLRSFVSKRSIWLSEEMLVVDRRGFVVHAAEGARRRLDLTASDDFSREMKRVINAAEPAHSWEQNCRARFPNASLEIVQHEGQVIGCIVVMHQARRARAAPIITKPNGEATITFEQIIGECAPMREARARSRKLAASALPVLIEGETGVGKELFARAIKQAGPAAGGAFVPLNCGGMPRDLIASELFGYAKGAFTGADERGRAGKIETADGGVLCLDEIGEMPLDLQSYLLRVLEDGVVYRIGEHEGRRVDIRILSMTNRDLTAEVEAGRFRRDLYYRIAATRLRIPPLRERGEDVVALAQEFAAAAAARLAKAAPDFAPEVLERLRAHTWPGNVRELRNVVVAMVALTDSDLLDWPDLPPELSDPPAPIPREKFAAAVKLIPAQLASKADLRAAERTTILSQVEACAGNLTQAARRLGIARSTLYLKLAEYRGEPSTGH